MCVNLTVSVNIFNVLVHPSDSQTLCMSFGGESWEAKMIVMRFIDMRITG